jgi:paraquat-inducible protein B
VDGFKPGENRRNVLDIVADLGFIDRKAQASAQSVTPDTRSPALSLVPPVAPAAVDANIADPHNDIVSALTEAQRQAAEQRIAAEQYLKETLELEKRLAVEAAQARAAGVQARAQQLVTKLEEARAAEQKAHEYAETFAKKLTRVASEKAEADALRTDDRLAAETAAAEVAAAEAVLAESRRRLEIATASCSESARRFEDASAAEQAAHAEAAAAEARISEGRALRERLEDDLGLIQEHALPLAGTLASATTPEPRRAVDPADEAAKRIAERRAADHARSAAS